jgi:hypothetical protein
MNELELLNRHTEVSETIGFDIFKDCEPIDIIGLYDFARVIWNYEKMDERLNV